jgi:hypothetical protein
LALGDFRSLVADLSARATEGGGTYPTESKAKTVRAEVQHRTASTLPLSGRF